jgi:hypothetical protein
VLITSSLTVLEEYKDSWNPNLKQIMKRTEEE